MEVIIDYFENISSAHRSIILWGGLAFFFLLENAAPLFKGGYNKVRHTGLNVFFTVTTILVNFTMAFLLLYISNLVVEQNIGLLQWIPMGVVAMCIIGLLLLDFISAWLAHWVEHHVKWMWQFHVIHHTDQHVDSTTANRHHPGESVIRFSFTILAVLLVGAPIWLVFLYQSMSAFLSQFNHSNISMPEGLDRALNMVFCTPNMHRVHHHYRQPYSDSNYGNIFSFWDRLAGTYKRVNNTKLVYGVDTYMDKKEASSMMNLLKMPFAGYRQPVKYDSEEEL